MPIEMEKIIFYHVPKTGGTSLTEMLLKVGGREIKIPKYGKYDLTMEHASPQMYPSNKMSFALFRNPVGWYKSLWAYKMQNCKDRWDGPLSYREDFNEFVNQSLLDFPEGFLSEVYREFKVDKKFLFEDGLGPVVKWVYENEGVELEILMINVTDKDIKSHAVISPEMEKNLREVERYAFNVWDSIVV